MKMEFHLGVLLFLASPCICVSARSFLRRMLAFSSNTYNDPTELGDLITTERGEPSNPDWRYMFSDGDGETCEMLVINELREPVLFCWVDHGGELHHFAPINDGSIQDNSVSNRHLETTSVGHSFVCFRRSDKLPSSLSEVRRNDLICIYRPTQGKLRHVIHLHHSLRGPRIDLSCEKLVDKGDLIDQSKKPYKRKVICGFLIHYEEDVFDDLSFKNAFLEDLEAVCSLLPQEALVLLQTNTPFWINKSFVYGHKNKPIVGRNCCFHPQEGADWLIANGHCVEKCGGVEIYSRESYLSDRHLWGAGGVLVHELSHAYHNKYCPGGFDCKEVLQAYNRAMSKKLYDAVDVHGSQGLRGKAKAYSCTNAMEFWAELSTAYHWHKDEATEYNKWFPFNRHQLIQHDVESFFVLHKLWGRN